MSRYIYVTSIANVVISHVRTTTRRVGVCIGMGRILPKRAWLTVAQALALASTMLPGPAMGQNAAASESLFQRGVSEMLQSRYTTACPALQESYALEPKAGTKFTLAECEAKWGRVATAVAHYSDYLGLVESMSTEQRQRHADRAGVARKQLETLRPRVPVVTLVLDANAPEGTTIELDGVALRRASLGVATPMDPGEHVVVTQAPKGSERVLKFEVRSGERKQIELTVDAVQRTAMPSQPSANLSERVQKTSPKRATHTWAYVAGGVGIAGLATGAIAGVMSLKQKQIVDDNCVGSACNAKGIDAANTGRSLATASTIGFGVGLAGTATAVVLWLTAPQPKATERGRLGWSLAVAGDGCASATIGMRGAW